LESQVQVFTKDIESSIKGAMRVLIDIAINIGYYISIRMFFHSFGRIFNRFGGEQWLIG
jgi:hypothetical protein